MTLLLVSLLLASLLQISSGNKANKHKPWIEAEYQGIVMENDNTVLLNPPLFALDKDAPLRYAGEICGFRLHGSGVPFKAVILDKATGEGLIRAKEPVDCEAQKEHTFTTQAYDCVDGPDGANTKKSHKATVHVRVNDVNEFAPVFVERLYRAAVTEGKLYDRILRVEAIDGDCSPQYSQICYYEILTPNTPFLIDNDGNIENTEKLQYSGEKLYKFTVTAYDCGKKRAADDAEVEIQVKPTCKPSWQGWNKRIEYAPGAGSLALFPGIRLETCDEPLWNIQATIELQTSHVAKGCDRDNYSERALRKLCGAATGEVDLLPMPGPNANWTAGLSVHYSQDSSLIYWFNGTQAVQVPLGGPAGLGSGPQDGLSDHFTLSFWMKHSVTPSKGKKEEETIVCNTIQNEDGYSHYSLTVHGCRIAFLYWPLLESARPVKFLWKLEQVCDDEWHHYALNLEFPTVTLYTDGISFDPALIHDNGLIHPPRREPALMIGACWSEEKNKEKEKGGENSTDTTSGDPLPIHHYFHGYLAGFSVRSGRLESREVIECLYACREGLDYRDFESLGKGMKVHVNPSQSLLTLEGDDVETFNHALQHVAYMNTLRFATPGVRPLRLTTAVKCFSEESCVSIPEVEGYVVVLQPDAPQILLSGTAHFARPAVDFEGPEGVPLFPDLQITCSISHQVEAKADESWQGTVTDTRMSDEIVHNLDGCEISLVGDDLDPERESLLLDMASLQQRGLELTNRSAYLTIAGVETITVYEEILRQARYQLRHGAALYARKFRLSCSEMNGRYSSNEFIVEVNVLHSMNRVAHPSHVLSSQQFLHRGHQPPPEMAGHSLASSHRNSMVPSAATLIIVVCVGFLVLMVILGLVRIHSLHRRVSGTGGPSGASADPKDPDLFWDDSALTIIVNPMESYQNQQTGVAGVAGGQQEEEDSSDSEAADSPSSDERRIIESPPHRY
ncbi:calsyntenin-3 precursor [Rattus norvegicus]|uniref:Calsyntenin-3 n=1 Tax=Rattus norvegicus TaxID=10116 RepID=CSTN3_RAT|nr:calsyntenin-3 precursor [Rattus norvegicus]Q8R553.1 RecName: Full=Calsyntenin-3; Flags: Precursor [Rattus norvegicus]CAD24292.1 calsyntenin-3 [Rattus norvegicus]|eukprot:NP_599203.1 calsyntenin-3 precursor [Rattus norvegicus]